MYSISHRHADSWHSRVHLCSGLRAEPGRPHVSKELMIRKGDDWRAETLQKFKSLVEQDQSNHLVRVFCEILTCSEPSH